LSIAGWGAAALPSDIRVYRSGSGVTVPATIKLIYYLAGAPNRGYVPYHCPGLGPQCWHNSRAANLTLELEPRWDGLILTLGSQSCLYRDWTYSMLSPLSVQVDVGLTLSWITLGDLGRHARAVLGPRHHWLTQSREDGAYFGQVIATTVPRLVTVFGKGLYLEDQLIHARLFLRQCPCLFTFRVSLWRLYKL
jgi:hypothetical protein